MKAVYVETSALLHHLLGEGSDLAPRLEGTGRLFTSAITFVEADRGLRRAHSSGRISRMAFNEADSWLWRFSAACQLIPADETILVMARRDFPVEPIRAINALHVASALWCASAVGPLEILSLDDRVRANSRALGLSPVP